MVKHQNRQGVVDGIKITSISKFHQQTRMCWKMERKVGHL